MPTPKQLALVHAARRALALGEDDYRAILHRIGLVESAKELTPAGLACVLAEFERLGFHLNRPASFGRRAGMATPCQIEYIQALWSKWRAQPGDAGLSKWLEDHYRVSALRFLDSKTAGKAITGLKAMTARKASA